MSQVVFSSVEDWLVTAVLVCSGSARWGMEWSVKAV